MGKPERGAGERGNSNDDRAASASVSTAVASELERGTGEHSSGSDYRERGLERGAGERGNATNRSGGGRVRAWQRRAQQQRRRLPRARARARTRWARARQLRSSLEALIYMRTLIYMRRLT